MSDIFISYARPDREAAATLAAQLFSAGYTVWWDRDLLSGNDFEQVIQQELSDARAVIVVWSATSVKSGWVRDEAAFAKERGVLVPVLLDGTLPPMGFRSLHATRLDPGAPTGLLQAVARMTATAPRPLLPAPRPRGTLVIEYLLALLLGGALATMIWRILTNG